MAGHVARDKDNQSALPAETAEKLRLLVRALAKIRAEADYKASKAQASPPPKGSSS